jgi:dipeptidyl aminopeptidase/acylaminoacyl peptidase
MKALVLFFSSLSFIGMAAAQAPQLTIDDLLSSGNFRGGGEGVLSPDGSTFAKLVRGQIVLTPAKGGSNRTLTSSPDAKSELSWSHDGKQLAYISGGDVWTVSVSHGTQQRLTRDPVGPGDPRGASDHRPLWNPNGHWILYQSGRKGFNELYVVSEDAKQEQLLAATEIYKGPDVIPSNSPDHGDAVSSDRFDPNPQWSPDGTRISYTERSREFFSGKLNILKFDAKSGAASGPPLTLYTAKNDPGGAWAINTAAWSPDSKTLTVVLQESGWDKLWQISSTGGIPKQLTKETGEDELPVYSPDGRWIVFTSNRDLPEERHLWVIASDGGAPHRLTHLSGIEGNAQWSADSKEIYFTRATALTSPHPYVVAANGGGEPRPLEPIREGKYEALGIVPDVAHFRGKDGLPLAGILYKPAGYKPGERYPAVIWAHGGPEGQVQLSLNPWSLFLAQKGYVVFEPNFRGSTGYGERFRNANVEDSGGGEIDDIDQAVQYLVTSGIADPNRVAIGGGSHGGTVVANAVTKLPTTFAAGIEMFGVVDRALFLQYTNRNSKIRWETKMGGSPEAKPAVYRKANVLPDVARIQTPLLILHGEEDPQVPPQESVEFTKALREAGKKFIYVTYPHEGHGFQQREHREDAYRRQVEFLDKYLHPNPPQQLLTSK